MLVVPGYIRDVFSLQTLDSRLVQSRTTPTPRLDDPSPSSSSSQPNGRKSETESPARWKSLEFFVYYGVVLVVVPMMFKVTYDLSKESHPNYPKYQHLLKNGWIPGRKVDNSDMQYSGFRNNIPILAVVLVVHAILRRLFDMLWAGRNVRRETSQSRLSRRVVFDLLFSFIFLSALHGFSVFKILVILLINFCISGYFGGSIGNPIATWIFNIGILFANEMFRGYKYSHMIPWLAAGEGGGFGYAMDRWGGIMPRWEIHFNFTVLRLISYNLDYYWSQQEGDDGAAIEKKQVDGVVLSERERINIPCGQDDYSLFNYLAYALYSPLYLAGPIITYNDFIAQVRNPIPTNTPSRTIKYAIRTLFAILTIELILHYLYVVAISKTKQHGSWENDTPFQLAMIGYFNLHIIWLKLLIPWRWFRLWAMVDDIDAPENMLRCMSNNYSASGFWRGWHRSFNRWVIRYIYIPIGGSKRAILNTLAVFTFVALWHDITMQLLIWGWLITLFVIPEVVAKMIFPARKFTNRPTLYRHLCALGAVGNILMMMAANLVGFAIGMDGLKMLVKGVMDGWRGFGFFVTACSALFVGTQIMFEVRESEARKGVNLKC